jgi:ABC-type Co2+ transport system permease subunit
MSSENGRIFMLRENGSSMSIIGTFSDTAFFCALKIVYGYVRVASTTEDRCENISVNNM